MTLNTYCYFGDYPSPQYGIKKQTMLELCLNPEQVEAGCDEAGRGCLAGPVFAAAVILPKDFRCDLLNDSKQEKDKERYELRSIIEKEAVTWAVGIVDQTEIDKINILNASFLAMHRALDQLSIIPESLLIDGNRFKKYKEINHTCIIKGDGKYLPIAAASILAKTYRDDFMLNLHNEYLPRIALLLSIKHRKAIEQFGATPYHRMTFTLLNKQLSLDF